MRRLACSTILLVLGTSGSCSHDSTSPPAPSAPSRAAEAQSTGHARYTVVDLGTLGGASSGASTINNKGWVAGFSNLPNNQSQHAFLWRSGEITDLGTLGGPNSVVFAALAKSNRGDIAGQAETSAPDPLHENFCSFAGPPGFNGGLTCLGFLWRDGVMTALPTLGGNNAQAYGVNDRGQVVGVAETAVHDPTCVAPQVLDYEAVIWGPKAGELHELPPLPGDRVAVAVAINEQGQVVGASLSCGPVDPGRSAHAVLWEHGSVTNLGSLGGALDNVPLAINNRGQVVGFSHLAGDVIEHAFFWGNGTMTDLGPLPGDIQSFASAIDEQGDVIGTSCDVNFNCRAVMWQHGVVVDLNTLIASGSTLSLIGGADINDRGEIAGQGFDPRTGDTPAFLAIPNSAEDAAGLTAERVQSTARTETTLPENVRRALRQRLRHGRLGW